MKRKLFYLASLACFMLLPFGCVMWTDKDNPFSQNTSTNNITIYGNVSDAETGNPLDNVTVSAVLEESVGSSMKTVTGSDGNYEMEVSNMDMFYIVAERSKYAKVKERILPNFTTGEKTIKVDIQMHKNAVIYQGKVTDKKGLTMENAKVSVKSERKDLATTFTDQYGEYVVEVPRLTDDQSDDYDDNSGTDNSWTNEITVSKDGYKNQNQSMSHTISDLGKTITVNFELSDDETKQIRVKGDVKGSNGYGVYAYLTVYHTYNNESSYYVGSVSANGSYSISFVPANRTATTYFFNMSADGYRTITQKLTLSSNDCGRVYTLNFNFN